MLKQIKSEKFKTDIEKIRTLVEKNEDYSNLKKKLPAFTVSGTFKETRKKENFEHYTFLVVLDYDKLSKNELETLQSELKHLDYVYSFFVSPSGKGLKVIVAVDSDSKHHETAFFQVVKVFNERYEIPIDTSGNDISRLCFLSYDPDLYLNSEPKPFPVQLENSVSYDAAFFQAVQLTELKFSYEDGNRNNFVYHLACNANRLGIPKQDVESSILNKFDLDEEEVIRTIDGAYINNESEHGKTKESKPIVDRVEEMLLTRYEFRFNEVTLRVEVLDKQSGQNNFELLTDYKENSILRWLLKQGLKVNQSLLKSIIRSDFSQNFNVFSDYFNHLPKHQDGVDHIAVLAKTVKTHNDELWHLCLKKWLVAMVACALTDKTNHTVLVLAGKQGIGKTTWIINLIPPVLRDYVYSGNINPNNKDTLVQLSECLLINMDELESLNKSEIGTLKEIITKDSIRIRKAYGHNQENMPRRASFSGSVNSMQFLNDTTGSRRFLCFEAFNIDYSNPVNHTGIYSQAIALLKDGFQYWLNHQEIEMVSKNNEQFQLVSPEEELLMAYFEQREISEADLFLTNSDILNRLIIKTNNNKLRTRALGNALVKNNFRRIKRKGQQLYAIYEKSLIEIDEQSKTNK